MVSMVIQPQEFSQPAGINHRAFGRRFLLGFPNDLFPCIAACLLYSAWLVGGSMKVAPACADTFWVNCVVTPSIATTFLASAGFSSHYRGHKYLLTLISFPHHILCHRLHRVLGYSIKTFPRALFSL